MIIELFGFLLLISIALIIIGLFKQEESAYSLIGFFFLFLLGMIILNGNLQVDKGANVTSTYGYDASGNIASNNQTISYSYFYWQDSTSHQVGYWLVIVASLGFFGVLFTIDRVKNYFRRNKDDED